MPPGFINESACVAESSIINPPPRYIYSMSLHSKEIRAFKGPAATRRAIQELYKTRVGGPAREMCNMLQSALLKKDLHFSEKKKKIQLVTTLMQIRIYSLRKKLFVFSEFFEQCS